MEAGDRFKIFTFCSGLLQTASINKGAEKSKNEGKFSFLDSQEFFSSVFKPDDNRAT